MSSTVPRPDANLEIGMEGDRVIARLNGAEAGAIGVPRIQFQWDRGVVLPMAGIAGVHTAEPLRKFGVGGRMMAAAVEHSKTGGRVCGGVTTSVGNVSRRLYARAGYEHVLTLVNLTRTPRPDAAEAPRGFQIRKYEPADAPEIVQLRRAVYNGFGLRRPDPALWTAQHQKTLSADPECILPAVNDGKIIGWAAYLEHWSGLRGQLCVGDCPNRADVATTLVRALEARLAARKFPVAKFTTAPTDEFAVNCLIREGYDVGPTRVLMVKIFDLQGLLNALAPRLNERLSQSAAAAWQGTLTLEMDGASGRVELNGGGPKNSTFAASRPILTQVLCGTLSGWEAYLRGLLHVQPKLDAETAVVFQAVLPAVPACHPVDEWW